MDKRTHRQKKQKKNSILVTSWHDLWNRCQKTHNPGQKQREITIIKQLQDDVLAVPSAPTHCTAIRWEAKNVAPRICKHRKCFESLNFNQLIIKRWINSCPDFVLTAKKMGFHITLNKLQRLSRLDGSRKGNPGNKSGFKSRLLKIDTTANSNTEVHLVFSIKRRREGCTSPAALSLFFFL